MMTHFQICVWESHVLIQWGIVYEAKNKVVFAKNKLIHLGEIREVITLDYQWFKDHMKPTGTRHGDMSREDFIHFADRLKRNWNGEIMVGKIKTTQL